MEQFTYERPKANYDAAFTEIDLIDWLELETIQNVTYSAVDSSGGDATSEVLDLGRSSYTINKLYPFIKGGINFETYTVICRVTTLEGTDQEFRIRFRIREAP